jgi:hypothetical protein
MNENLGVILNRKSTREFLDKAISEEIKAHIIGATLRAPTAGNLMLYSIIEVNEQAAKDTLAVSCDHQPFIARAQPLSSLVSSHGVCQTFHLFAQPGEIILSIELFTLPWYSGGMIPDL